MRNHDNEKRQFYKQLENKYQGKPIAESYLRVERQITNNDSILTFDVRKTGNERATEKKLDLADVFVIFSMGFYLLADETAKPGKAILQTYPNAFVFPDETTNFFGRELETIYNGALSIKSGQTVLIDSQRMADFRYVPQTLQSSATNFGQFEPTFGQKAFPTRIELKGTQNTEISVKFPVWSGIKIDNTNAGFKNYLVFVPIGFLIKNAA